MPLHLDYDATMALYRRCGDAGLTMARIGYSDQIMHLHEALFGVRNGIVEQVIPVAGRGRLQ